MPTDAEATPTPHRTGWSGYAACVPPARRARFTRLAPGRGTGWLVGLLVAMVLFAPAPVSADQVGLGHLHGSDLGATMIAPSTLVVSDPGASAIEQDTMPMLVVLGLGFLLLAIAVVGWPVDEQRSWLRLPPFPRSPAWLRGPPR